MNKEHEHHALASACEWYAILNDESVSEKDKNDWHRWLNQSPKHGQAWQRVEQAGRHLSGLDPTLARAALNAPKGMGRRAALKKLSVGLLGLFGAGYLAQSHYAEQLAFQILALSAQYQTDIGQNDRLQLADQSQVWLNTGTCVDIDYNAQQRGVYLRNGEILVQTAPDYRPTPRRLFVKSAQGQMTARGTRFSVRSGFQNTIIAVFDGQVDIENLHGQKQTLQPGQQVGFTATAIGLVEKAESFRSSWTKGLLVVDNWPLIDFIEELQRYSKHNIELDERLNQRRLVGTFSTRNLSQTLESVANALNLDIHQNQHQAWQIFP